MFFLILLFFVYGDYPVAVAKLCGNVVVHDSQKEKVIKQVKSQGCSEIQLVELENDYYLVYGVRVLRGE